MYTDALTAAAEQHAGPAIMARIDTAAAALGAHVTDAQAWPVLRRNLALLAIEGHDPITPCTRPPPPRSATPMTPPPCSTGACPPHPAPAAETVGPLRWLPAIPDVLTTHPQWGPYLHARAELVTELADQIRATARAWEHRHRTRLGAAPARSAACA